MSTRCSIKYSDDKIFNFHFYREIFDDDAVYLELNGNDYIEEHNKYGVVVRIPIEIWETIREHKIDLRYANLSDEDIEKIVNKEVDERIRKYSENNSSFDLFIGCAVYGLANEPKEDQIKKGMEHFLNLRGRQKEIQQKIKDMKDK